MQYFRKSFETAREKAEQYRNRTQAQRSNIAFCAAGNLGRGASNRLLTIRETSQSLYGRQCVREVMLQLWETELFRVSGTFGNGQPYLTDIQWEKIDRILDMCQAAKYVSDPFEYWKVSFFSKRLTEKLEALVLFVDTHGTKTDKKLLIPKLTPTPHRQLALL